jgi:uncharacterized membrane protein YbhN (UPF0104 family)
VLLVVGLVGREAVEIDWAGVVEKLHGYRWPTLAIGVAIALPGYLACASYDLVGRHCTGHDLPPGRTAAISYVGYCLSLNLGALIGGLAFRYRLYAPSELPAWTIGKVIALSVLTNWSGYVLLAGSLLAFAPPELPDTWGTSAPILRACGVVLLMVAASYVWLCIRRGGETLRFRGRSLEIPSFRVLCVQLALSLVSWSAIGGALAWLLPEVSWLAVMPVLLTASIAGVVSHVPGGLGVTETVFVAMLGHEVGRPQLLGALLAFRATYYLVPFAFALAIYAVLEATAGSVTASAPNGAKHA